VSENPKEITDKYIEYQKIQGKSYCPICGNFFKHLGFGNHYRICKERKGDWTKKSYYNYVPVEHKDIYYCRYCNNEFSTWLQKNGHEMYCVENPNREKNLKKREEIRLLSITDETKRKMSIHKKEYHKTRKEIGKENFIGRQIIHLKTKEGKDENLGFNFKDEL